MPLTVTKRGLQDRDLWQVSLSLNFKVEPSSSGLWGSINVDIERGSVNLGETGESAIIRAIGRILKVVRLSWLEFRPACKPMFWKGFIFLGIMFAHKNN